MKPGFPSVVPDRDRYRNWYLDENIVHVLHNGDILKINKGFRFDGHSVPLLFRWLFRRYNKQDIIAALVHDYLVDTEPWHRYNRSFMDKEYKILMQRYSTRLRSFWMPLAVSVWGYVCFTIWGDYRGDAKPGTSIEVVVATMV